MPLLIHEGKTYNESVAILRFVCAKLGYYPTDKHTAWHTDALTDYINDHLVKLAGMVFGRQEWSEEEGAAF